MDKEFRSVLIWSFILVVGFSIGFVAGLKIPKDITIDIGKDSREILNKSFDSRLLCNEYRLNLSRCEWDNNYLKDKYGSDNTPITCIFNENKLIDCNVTRTVWDDNSITYEINFNKSGY